MSWKDLSELAPTLSEAEIRFEKSGGWSDSSSARPCLFWRSLGRRSPMSLRSACARWAFFSGLWFGG